MGRLKFNLRASVGIAACFHVLTAIAAENVNIVAMDDTTVMEGADSPHTYYTDRHDCPQPCGSLAPSKWTVYSSYPRLRFCDQPLLFDFTLDNPVADPDTPTKLRVCALENSKSAKRETDTQTEQETKAGCNAVKALAAASESPVTMELAHGGVGSGTNTGEATAAVWSALQQLMAYFSDERAACEETVMFSYQHGTIAGLYLGKSIGRATLSSAAKALHKQMESSGAPTQAIQLCGEGRNADHVLGLVVDTAGNITAVQNAVRGWNEAKCLVEYEAKTPVDGVAIWEDTSDLFLMNSTFGRNSTNSTLQSRFSHLAPRADCRVEKVIAGDGCWALASRCGISQDDLLKYNPDKDFCNGLQPEQRVCCSSGSLPDIRPKIDKDGNCFKYLVLKGDTCGTIAAAHGLKATDIDKFNNGTTGTWGWYGCSKLNYDMYICLSDGRPPMPFPITNAVCGPTKPNSTAPTGHHTLIEVNPCPLNACCNVWGQCGISGDFCKEKKSESGNPGTSGIKDGCVSNCGMDIVKSSISQPLGRIGYYETWNFNRPCLHMFADSINVGGGYAYTIVHWAFAEVNTADWTVKIRDDYNQWAGFKRLKNVKKVISFGGWGYSTEPETYDILRQAIGPTNRAKFAQNVADFLVKEGLDGADFDWEYPGAMDIDGTPPGLETDGLYYLRFLQTMREKMPQGKTLSIAAPASYWYLKNFPIKSMSQFLDYIVYMTYDLHGQWDYTPPEKKSYIEGCDIANCVRSHVNLTETTYALSMITKAGVPSQKIYVGESSYGRSFKLAKPGCKGPMCQFVGTRLESKAAKGRCTNTAGYISNAEIEEIINSARGEEEGDHMQVESWHDAGSNSDMLLYDNTEWVAYMSETTRETRRLHWMNFNFAGTIDWAVDLRAFSFDDMRDVKTGNFPEDKEPLPKPLGECKDTGYDTLEKINDAKSLPEHCAALYAVEVLAKRLKDAMASYDDLVKNGYDSKFNTYADAVVQGGTKAVREWVYNNGEKYFTCTVTESIECCQVCHSKNECDRCSNDVCGGWNSLCDGPVGNDPLPNCYTTNGWVNVTEPCPPNQSMRNYEYKDYRGMFPATYWSLRKDKEAEFWAELLKATGIAKDDIRIQNLQSYNECSSGADETNRCANVGWDYNFPVPTGYEKSDVTNPKQIVSDAYNNLKDIVRDLPEAVRQLRKGVYQGLASDLADAISLPVFMIEEAVGGIKGISDAIDKANEERTKNIIIAFLTSIFFFIPIVGQLVGSVAALANIGRIIAILGAVGEIAVDIYQVVDTKGNDPLVIFGLVLAPVAIFDIVKIAKAASVARAMKPDDYGKLGRNVRDKMDLYRGVANKHRTCVLKNKRSLEFPVGGLPMSSLNVDPVWSRSL